MLLGTNVSVRVLWIPAACSVPFWYGLVLLPYAFSVAVWISTIYIHWSLFQASPKLSSFYITLFDRSLFEKSLAAIH